VLNAACLAVGFVKFMLVQNTGTDVVSNYLNNDLMS